MVHVDTMVEAKSFLRSVLSEGSASPAAIARFETAISQARPSVPGFAVNYLQEILAAALRVDECAVLIDSGLSEAAQIEAFDEQMRLAKWLAAQRTVLAL